MLCFEEGRQGTCMGRASPANGHISLWLVAFWMMMYLLAPPAGLLSSEAIHLPTVAALVRSSPKAARRCSLLFLGSGRKSNGLPFLQAVN